MRELAELEIDQYEAAQQAVVEDEVDIEMIALDSQSDLAPTKLKPLPNSRRKVSRRSMIACSTSRS